jgi:hypothetical protein
MRSAIATNTAGERHPGDLEHGVGECAADGADEQVAGDVAGDGLGAVVGDPLNPLGALRREKSECARDDFRSFEHGQIGQDEDRHGRDDRGARAAQHVERGRAETCRVLADACLVVLHEFHGVGALQQPADRASPGPRVVDQDW